jgi:hypothetical protein
MQLKIRIRHPVVGLSSFCIYTNDTLYLEQFPSVTTLFQRRQSNESTMLVEVKQSSINNDSKLTPCRIRHNHSKKLNINIIEWLEFKYL